MKFNNRQSIGLDCHPWFQHTKYNGYRIASNKHPVAYCFRSHEPRRLFWEIRYTYTSINPCIECYTVFLIHYIVVRMSHRLGCGPSFGSISVLIYSASLGNDLVTIAC